MAYYLSSSLRWVYSAVTIQVRSTVPRTTAIELPALIVFISECILNADCVDSRLADRVGRRLESSDSAARGCPLSDATCSLRDKDNPLCGLGFGKEWQKLFCD